jgi:carbon-monoxide dehydrogenase large subunit
MNAVVDALRPYGIRHIDMPATPERVWQAMRDAVSSGSIQHDQEGGAG